MNCSLIVEMIKSISNRLVKAILSAKNRSFWAWIRSSRCYKIACAKNLEHALESAIARCKFEALDCTRFISCTACFLGRAFLGIWKTNVGRGTLKVLQWHCKTIFACLLEVL